MAEIDARVRMLNAILDVPHGDMASYKQVHEDIMGQDPWFYLHLAAWYEKNGEVRDHKVMFPATLSAARDPELMRLLRANGNALLRLLPPYQVARLLRFVTETIGHRPRSLRRSIEDYLRALEEDDNRFDGAVMSSRNDLTYLYATLHIKPSDRAHAILFDDNPPEGSRPWAVKQAAAAPTTLEKAQIIVDYNLPWQIASSIINPKNPVGLAALVSVMSPAQIINNQAAIKAAGGMDHADIRKMVTDKLKLAKTDKRVSAYKATVAREAAGVDDEIGEMLADVRETQVKARGEIKARTAIMVDISQSMHEGIEVTKQLAPMVAAICTNDLHILAFNTNVYEMKVPQEVTIDYMEGAFRGLRPNGMTSIGLPVEFLRRNRTPVDQFLFITDEDENTAPSFETAYTGYVGDVGLRPTVTIVRVGHANDKIQRACQRMMVECNAFDFKGDYYALPGVIPFLTGKTRADLVMEIMDYPLLVEAV